MSSADTPSADSSTVPIPKKLVPDAVSRAVIASKKPESVEAAREFLAWVADADLDAAILQIANYTLASTTTDKGEQERRHGLSAVGPAPDLAALSGLRAGVLAEERGDHDAAEALLTLASGYANVQTADGVVTIDAGCWAATRLGALFIGQNRLIDAERAYGRAAVSTNSQVLDAVSQGMKSITELRSPQRPAAEPPAVA